MNEYIASAHKLPYFNITTEFGWIPCVCAEHIIKTSWIINLTTPERYPDYKAIVHKNYYETVKIKDNLRMKYPHILKVKFDRHKCSELRTAFVETIPFKLKHHLITKRLEKPICNYLNIGIGMKQDTDLPERMCT